MWYTVCCGLVLFGTFIGKLNSLMIGKNQVNASNLFDFNERLRLLLSDVVSPSLTKTQQSLDVYDFQMKSGYQSALYPSPKDASHVYGSELRILHTCGEEFIQYSNVFLEGNKQKRVFNSQRLLQLLRHKQIAFVGDSLARQFFLDLSAELRPLQTFLQYGKAPEIFTLLTDSQFSLDDRADLRYPTGDFSWEPSPFTQEDEIPLLQKENFMRRYYAGHNATLLWCHDPFLSHLQDHTFSASLSFAEHIAKVNHSAHISHCDLSALFQSHFLVVGVGVGFKPFHNEDPSSHLYRTKDYHQEMEDQARLLNSAAYTYRSVIQKENPSVHVFWSLLPHVGFVDELRHPQTSLHATHASDEAVSQANDAGTHWSNLTLAALYPTAFNVVLNNVARSFNDEHLDVFQVSLLHLLTQVHGFSLPVSRDTVPFQSLKMHDIATQSQRVSQSVSQSVSHSVSRSVLHTDAVHYCPGSVFRSSLFLLQAAVEYRLELQRRRERKAQQATHNSHSNVNENVPQGDERPTSVRPSVAVFDVSLSDMGDENPFHLVRKHAPHPRHSNVHRTTPKHKNNDNNNNNDHNNNDNNNDNVSGNDNKYNNNQD